MNDYDTIYENRKHILKPGANHPGYVSLAEFDVQAVYDPEEKSWHISFTGTPLQHDELGLPDDSQGNHNCDVSRCASVGPHHIGSALLIKSSTDAFLRHVGRELPTEIAPFDIEGNVIWTNGQRLLIHSTPIGKKGDRDYFQGDIYGTINPEYRPAVRAWVAARLGPNESN